MAGFGRGGCRGTLAPHPARSGRPERTGGERQPRGLTALDATNPIKVCDEEVFEEMALNSYVLIQRLEAKYPDKAFLFACGSDRFTQILAAPE
jgi:hypothetical protein